VKNNHVADTGVEVDVINGVSVSMLKCIAACHQTEIQNAKSKGIIQIMQSTHVQEHDDRAHNQGRSHIRKKNPKLE
jgi:hypothetical protein